MSLLAPFSDFGTDQLPIGTHFEIQRRIDNQWSTTQWVGAAAVGGLFIQGVHQGYSGLSSTMIEGGLGGAFFEDDAVIRLITHDGDEPDSPQAVYAKPIDWATEQNAPGGDFFATEVFVFKNKRRRRNRWRPDLIRVGVELVWPNEREGRSWVLKKDGKVVAGCVQRSRGRRLARSWFLNGSSLSTNVELTVHRGRRRTPESLYHWLSDEWGGWREAHRFLYALTHKRPRDAPFPTPQPEDDPYDRPF